MERWTRLTAGLTAGMLLISAAAGEPAPGHAPAADPAEAGRLVVIFIGGARDNRGQSGPVRDYVGTLPPVPGQTLLYFGQGQEKAAMAAASRYAGKASLRIVGHSWGGHAAIRVAAGAQGRVAYLVGVDPVGKPFRRGRRVPESVDHVILVQAVPAEEDGADRVEEAGKLVGGVPAAYRESADTVIRVPTSHAYFAEQYTAAGEDGRSARDLVETIPGGRPEPPPWRRDPELPGVDRMVHPAARDGVRDLWAVVPYPGPYLAVPIEAEEDLQARADEEDVAYVRFKAYPCSSRPDWRKDILAGPIFRVTTGGSDGVAASGKRPAGPFRYEAYLPVDLRSALAPLAGRRGDVDPMAELDRAEESGLCLSVYGARWFGNAFELDLQPVPAAVRDGRLVPSPGLKEKGPGSGSPPGPSVIR